MFKSEQNKSCLPRRNSCSSSNQWAWERKDHCVASCNRGRRKIGTAFCIQRKECVGIMAPKKDEEYAGKTYSAAKNIFLGNNNQVGLLFLSTMAIGLMLACSNGKTRKHTHFETSFNTSHILQPVDLSVFRLLKIKSEQELVKWQQNNYEYKLSKFVFTYRMSKIC